MKLFRALYLIIAAVLLLPVIVFVEVSSLVYMLYMTIKHKLSIRDTLRHWCWLLAEGARMNVDFVNNG